jgi:hypothetical protein
MVSDVDLKVRQVIAAALFKYANPYCDWQGEQLAMAISTFMAPTDDALRALRDAGYVVMPAK